MMKKLRLSSNKIIANKDLLNGFSIFTAFAICGYGIFMFLAVLNPQHFSYDDSGFSFGLDTYLGTTSFSSYRFSFASAEALKILSAIAGAVIALLQLSFLHRKGYCHGLMSQGIKRKRIFINRTFLPMVATIFVILIPKLFALKFNIDYFGISNTLLICFLADLFPIIAAVFVGFTATATACIFTGRTIEAAAGGISILILPFSLIFFIVAVFQNFLYGYDVDNISPVADFISYIDPIGYSCCFFAIPDNENLFYNPTTIILISALLWIVTSITVLITLKKYFEKSFKAENIGFKGTNKFMVFISCFSLPILLSAVIMTLMPTAFSTFPSQKFLIFTTSIAIAAGLACALVCNLVFNLTVKKLRTCVLSGVLQLLLTAVCLLIATTGVFGSYYTPPKTEDIVAVKVNAPFQHFLSTDFYGYFFNPNAAPSAFCLELTSEKDITSIIKIHNTVSDNGPGDVAASLNVIYLLNNGEKTERSFRYVTTESIPSLLKLWETDSARFFYKKLLFPKIESEQEFNWVECEGIPEIINQPQLTLSSATGKDVSATLTDNEFNKLKNAIYKDISTMSAEEWFNPKNKQLGILSFDCESDFFYVGKKLAFKLFITEDMSNTVTTLQNFQLYSFIQPTQRPIRALLCDIDAINKWASPTTIWDIKANQPYFVSHSFHLIDQYFDAFDYNITDSKLPATEITDVAEIQKLMAKGYMAYNIHTDGKILFVEHADGTYSAYVIPYNK